MKNQGLYRKYYIKKITNRCGEISLEDVNKDAEYFVLRLDDDGDKKHVDACRKAVLKYAEEIKDHLPELSKDLFKRYGGEMNRVNEKDPEMFKELSKEIEILKSMGLGDTERCLRKIRLLEK